MKSPKSCLCTICGQKIPQELSRRSWRKSCGSSDCQRTYDRNYASMFEIQQGIKARQEKQKQGREMIPCQVCGQLFEVIQTTHLKRHNLTINEYRILYPDAPLMTEYMKQKRGQGSLAQAHYLTYQGKEIDDYLCSFFAGSMLGDGSVEKQKEKLNARYCEGGNNQLYMKWKYDLMSQYYPCTFTERLSAPHVKSGKSYLGWWLRTSTHPDLTYLHRLWYKSKKVLPYLFIDKYFNEFSLAVWFCDDGHYSKRQKEAFFYTMSFALDEVEWLSIMLHGKYHLPNHILFNKKKQPFIRINSSATDKLKSIVAQFKIPGMEYKYQ